MRVEPVGDLPTLLARLRKQAAGAPVALGLDLPIGLPRAFVQAHLAPLRDFRAFLDHLRLHAIHAAMASLDVAAEPHCAEWIEDGSGADAAGEDRFDCLVGLLGLLQVVRGRRRDDAPDDPWITRWEGWILGQDPTSLPFRAVSVHS